jgi:hypothetical protein
MDGPWALRDMNTCSACKCKSSGACRRRRNTPRRRSSVERDVRAAVVRGRCRATSGLARPSLRSSEIWIEELIAERLAYAV